MYEIKSKKTGRTEILTEDEYNNLGKLKSRFNITELRTKPIVPSIKPPLEIKKPIKKKNDG